MPFACSASRVAATSLVLLSGRHPADGSLRRVGRLAALRLRLGRQAALADALRRALDAGITLDGASDHGVSEALYLRDLDGNGVELYWDRPQEEWPRTPDGGLAMFTRRLDLESLAGVQPGGEVDHA